MEENVKKGSRASTMARDGMEVKRRRRAEQARNRRIFIRVSEREFGEIRDAANAKGVSISRYLVEAHETSQNLEAARRKCEAGPVVEQLKAIRTEIWHIGHNVNQIAHNVNRDMSASLADEHSAAKAVRDCARLFDKASGIIKDSSGQND